MFMIKAQVSLVDGKYVPMKYFELYVSESQINGFSNLKPPVKELPSSGVP